MAIGNIFDTFKEAAGGLLGGLGDAATTAAESAGLGDVVQQASDALGGATAAAGDIAAQGGDALGGATAAAGDIAAQGGDALGGAADQAADGVAGITDTFTGGGK
jgi:hypothetical protein